MRRDLPLRFRPPLASAALLGLALLGGAPARSQDPDNCLFCHQYHGLSRYDRAADRLNVYYVNPLYTRAALGAHARLACTDCHPRDEVAVVPHKPVARVDCTQMCHLRDATGVEQRYTHSNVAEVLQRSAHRYEVLNRVEFSGGSLLAPEQSRCLYCHDEPLFRSPTAEIPLLSGLDAPSLERCETCHAEQIPVNVAYYVRHIAARLQPARATLEQAQVCAVCHSDPRVRTQFALPDAVASYLRSFHGKAALLGDQTTADCTACHVARRANAHLMLAASDPLASINPGQVANTCRSVRCHPGADPSLAAAAVHLDPATFRGTLEYALAVAFILFTLITFGPSMVIVVLELFSLVIGRTPPDAHRLEQLARRLWRLPEGRRRLIRFTVPQRVQHWILVVLFALLALTGFPLKFPDRGWAQGVITIFGGLNVSRTIHHWAGLALVVGLFAHLLYVLSTMVQRRRAAAAAGRRVGWFATLTHLPMWVTPQDARQMLHLLAYLLHIRHDRPIFGRFSVKEKFEYFGVFWGTVLLGVTGILLWGEQIASHYISGRLLNLAIIAHTYEAFLAVIHVGILHIINVMLHPLVFPLSPATLSGRTPIPLLAEEHTGQVLDVARALGVRTEGGAA
ncbi:MAG: cytochrome b/b6 domain-containing protein [Planctomycetota bacterium]